MWTKLDVVKQALEELGIASYVFDVEPELLESVKRRLDVMMAAWNAEGIRLGYPIDTPESSDIDSDTNLPDIAIEAVYTSLAVMIGPMLGKVVSETTKAKAYQGKRVMLSRGLTPPKQRIPATMPSGAGNRCTNPYLSPESGPVTDGSGGVIVE